MLLSIAACIWLLLPFITLCLEFRSFYLDPRIVRYQAVTAMPFFAGLVLPIIVLILFISRRRKTRRWFRRMLALSPVLLLTLPGFVNALFFPEDPDATFKDRMRHPVPADAIAFKAWYAHGGGDSTYMFTFRCSRESIEKLLAADTFHPVENPPMLDPDVGTFYQVPIAGITLPKGWPQPKTWNGLEVHSADVPNGFLYLLTDAERTRVLILAGDT